MKNVKIVFTDLDGTLTKEHGKIDIVNKPIIVKLTSIGIPVVLSTGRPLPYVIPLCKQFGLSNYVITSNGAEVYNIKAKKVIYQSIISKENIEKLDNLIKKYKMLFMANSITKRYTNKTDVLGFVNVNSLLDINEDLSQVVVESLDLQDMMVFRKDLEKETTLKVANKTKHIVEGKLLYYDITNKDSSKGEAIKTLCKHLNIDIQRTMAIGDSINDVDMFNVVGYKVAVSNASDELKALADTITLSNKENGVATILGQLYSELK